MEKKMDMTNTRPFNIEHAKAGAPFCGAGGEAVRVLIWNRKHPTHPIIAIEERGEQEAIAFRADGTSTFRESLGTVGTLVMLPLGMIDGKPVFAGDKIEDVGPDGCTAGIVHPANRDFTSSRWPSPAKAYPVTQMGSNELGAAWKIGAGLVDVANAALRHAVDAGQVVPVSEAKPGVRPHNPYTGQLRDPRDIESDPMGALIYNPGEPLRPAAAASSSARDMAVAEKVRIAAMVAWNPARGYQVSEDAQEIREHIRLLDLAAIIAGIPQ